MKRKSFARLFVATTLSFFTLVVGAAVWMSPRTAGLIAEIGNSANGVIITNVRLFDGHEARLKPVAGVRVDGEYISDIYEAVLPADDGALVFELERLQGFGMAPVDVLRAATSVPGRLLDRDPARQGGRLGTVSVGAPAELILLPGNPLEDVRTLQQLDLVFSGGRVFERVIPLARGR